MCGSSQSSRLEGFLQKKKKLFSKHSNHVPWLVSDVFVDCEDEHEHEEKAGTTKEVPDVVPDIVSTNQQDGIFTTSSPVIVLEHLARHIQFP